MHINQKGFINIILVVIIVALIGAGAYFISTRQITPPTPTPSPSPSPTPTPTPVPTPKPSPTPIPSSSLDISSSPSPTQQNEMAAWKTFTNTKYGYSFRYPANLRGPMHQCEEPPAGVCGEIGINTETNSTGLNPTKDDSIIIRALRWSKVSLDENFVRGVLTGATLNEPVQTQKISGRQVYSVIFTGWLGEYPDGFGGEQHHCKTFAMFVPLSGNTLLRIVYPLGFPSFTKGDNDRIVTSCYSDDRNSLYRKIVSTFVFTP